MQKITVLDSLWGTVSHCRQIAPSVFMVDTVRPDRDVIDSGRWQQGGIMVLAELADRILPPRAVLFGEYGTHPVCDAGEKGEAIRRMDLEFLEFGNDGSQLVPLYELLASGYITSYDIIRGYHEYELVNDGRFQLPEYFGELIFPFSLYMHSGTHRRLDNGIWAFQCRNGAGLCVHNTVARYAMSPVALIFSKAHGNTSLFWEASAAIALLELADSFRSIDRLIACERASLSQVVKTHYPLYQTMANAYGANEWEDFYD